MPVFKEEITVFLFLCLFFFEACAGASAKKSTSKRAETGTDIKDAVQKIADTVEGKNVGAKFCPKCGRHYSSELLICPRDGTPLKEVH